MPVLTVTGALAMRAVYQVVKRHCSSSSPDGYRGCSWLSGLACTKVAHEGADAGVTRLL